MIAVFKLDNDEEINVNIEPCHSYMNDECFKDSTGAFVIDLTEKERLKINESEYVQISIYNDPIIVSCNNDGFEIQISKEHPDVKPIIDFASN